MKRIAVKLRFTKRLAGIFPSSGEGVVVTVEGGQIRVVGRVRE
jgi:uncharacterized protein YlxW (UPF0749 family)